MPSTQWAEAGCAASLASAERMKFLDVLPISSRDGPRVRDRGRHPHPCATARTQVAHQMSLLTAQSGSPMARARPSISLFARQRPEGWTARRAVVYSPALTALASRRVANARNGPIDVLCALPRRRDGRTGDPVAVILWHGMGQQIQFDDDRNRRARPDLRPPVATAAG